MGIDVKEVHYSVGADNQWIFVLMKRKKILDYHKRQPKTVFWKEHFGHWTQFYYNNYPNHVNKMCEILDKRIVFPPHQLRLWFEIVKLIYDIDIGIF